MSIVSNGQDVPIFVSKLQWASIVSIVHNGRFHTHRQRSITRNTKCHIHNSQNNNHVNHVYCVQLDTLIVHQINIKNTKVQRKLFFAATLREFEASDEVRWCIENRWKLFDCLLCASACFAGKAPAIVGKVPAIVGRVPGLE